MRRILGCEAHETISFERTKAYFDVLFREYGLPERIRSDDGVPFASSALARLSKLSVYFIRLGIYPELIEPGHPEQNGIHERMHRTLKAETTIPPEYSMAKQQKRFDEFRDEFNTIRPHQGIGMKTPADLYQRSSNAMPEKIKPYEYPGHYIVCFVSKPGTIRIVGNQCFVSSTVVHDYVGLEEVDDRVFDVFYRFYHIGRYDARENRVKDVISRVPVLRPQVEVRPQVLPMSGAISVTYVLGWYLSSGPLFAGAELYPLGWSPDAKFAYSLVDEPPFRGSYGFLYAYIDTITDEVLWNHYDHSDQFDWQGDDAPTDAAWMRNGPAINQLLAQFGVRPVDAAPVAALPIRHGWDVYSARVNEWQVNPDARPYGNDVVGYTLTLRSQLRGSKAVAQRARIFATDIQVLGYLESPFEDRIVILVAESGNAYGGTRHTDFSLFGAHLEAGSE